MDGGSFLATHLQSALDLGKVTADAVDTAVGRLLRVQMRLGLFDPPEDQPLLAVRPLCRPPARR